MKYKIILLVVLLPFILSFKTDETDISGKWVFAKERTIEELEIFRKEKGVSDQEIGDLVANLDSVGINLQFKKDMTCEFVFIETPRLGTYTVDDTVVNIKFNVNDVEMKLKLNQERNELLLYPEELFPIVFKKE